MTIFERLDHLGSLLPPPEIPLHAGTEEEWISLVDRMALLLPNSYQYFVRRYGAGSLGVDGCEHPIINVLTPFDPVPTGNIIEQIPPILRDISDYKAEFPEGRPFPLLYEPGGFVPWGWSCEGDIYGWVDRGVTRQLADGCGTSSRRLLYRILGLSFVYHINCGSNVQGRGDSVCRARARIPVDAAFAVNT